MKPIFSQKKDSELKAIFTIDNEEENGVFLFSNTGVKRIEPDYIYFEENLVRFYYLPIEDYEKIKESLYVELDELPNLKEMLSLAGYCVMWSKEGFYSVIDSRAERDLPPLELQYP